VRIGLEDLVRTNPRIPCNPATRATGSPKRILGRIINSRSEEIRRRNRTGWMIIWRAARLPHQKVRSTTGRTALSATNLNNNCQRSRRSRRRSINCRLRRIRPCAQRDATKLLPLRAWRQMRRRFCLFPRDRGVCFSEVTKISVSFFAFL